MEEQGKVEVEVEVQVEEQEKVKVEEQEKREQREVLEGNYNWDKIAKRMLKVYKND